MKPTQKFITWLDSQIAHCHPGTKIAAADRLAAQWQISKSTVTRILARYQREGTIVRIPRKGSYLKPDEQLPAPLPAEKVSSSQSIINEIKYSIANGTIRKGDALPSIKFMSRQFKVAPQTVIQAYRQLQAETRIIKVGKMFWVGSFPELIRNRGKNTIFIFKTGNSDFARIFSDFRIALAYHRMEQELLDNGCHIRYENAARCKILFEEWRREDQWPRGIVLYRLQYDDCVRLRSFIEKVVRPRKDCPVSVLADIDSCDYRMLPRSVSMLSRGSIDTMLARAISDFVTSHKTEPVTFFFDYDRSALFNIFVLIKTVVELRAFNPDFVSRIVVTSGNTAFSRDSFLDLFRDTVPRERTDAIAGKYQHLSMAIIENQIMAFPRGDEMFRTAPRGLWIFTSDMHATEALDWARRSRTPVPDALSLISLENNPRFFHHGISSCIIDWSNTGYVMAHALLGDIPLRKTTRGFLRTRAMIIERKTTR